MPSRIRTPEEEDYRSYARLLCRQLGSRLLKIKKNHVAVSPNPIWPQGLITAFHGWVDVYARLVHCLESPDAIEDGIYLYCADEDYERAPALDVKKFLEEYPPNHPTFPGFTAEMSRAGEQFSDH